LPDSNDNFSDERMAAALKDLNRGGTPNRPDLSQRVESAQGRRAYSVIDEIRNRAGLPGTRSDAQVRADAAKLAALGDDFIDAMIERAGQGHGFNDAESRAVRDMVDRDMDGAIAAGDDAKIARLGNLILADRAAGTAQGRAFRQRRDPLSPAQRTIAAIREALSVDDTAMASAPTSTTFTPRTTLRKSWVFCEASTTRSPISCSRRARSTSPWVTRRPRSTSLT
jgi:hypothetical protein